MPTLRLKYQLSRNRPTQAGTVAVRLRIYAGQPPAFVTVCHCPPGDFIPAKGGRAAEIKGNRALTNLMRARMQEAEAIYLAMLQAGEPVTSQAIKARLAGEPEQDFLAWARQSIEADPELARSSKAQHRTLLGKVARFTGGRLAFSALSYALAPVQATENETLREPGTLPDHRQVWRRCREVDLPADGREGAG